MTRGRVIVWVALLAVGLVASLVLRTTRTPRPAPEEPRVQASSAPRPSADEATEVEVEVADPTEVGIVPRGAPTPDAPEAELNRTLAAAWQTEPERARALAEDGEKRFGESPRAVERRFYEIKSLVKLGRIGKARTKAETYLEKYPPGPMTDEIERLTGVHRRPPLEP